MQLASGWSLTLAHSLMPRIHSFLEGLGRLKLCLKHQPQKTTQPVPVKLLTLSSEAFSTLVNRNPHYCPAPGMRTPFFYPVYTPLKQIYFWFPLWRGSHLFFLNYFSYLQSSLGPYTKHMQPFQGQTRLFKNRLRHLLGPSLECLNIVAFCFQKALSFISMTFLIQCLFYSSTITILICEIQVCYLGSSVTRNWEIEFPPWITENLPEAGRIYRKFAISWFRKHA